MALTKFMILAAFMAALVVVADATIEDGRRGSRQCRRQLRSQWPDHCEQYMMQGMRRYMDHDDSQGREQYLERCCDELKMMQPQCQCEAMKMMVDEKGMMRQHRMMEKAMEIPMMRGTMERKCRMSSHMD